MYQALISQAQPSPLRGKCQIKEYQDPAQSCEYFGENITWAVLGDSHSTEIAFALADKLKARDEGITHFSFSVCKPSYEEGEGFSPCSNVLNGITKL